MAHLNVSNGNSCSGYVHGINGLQVIVTFINSKTVVKIIVPSDYKIVSISAEVIKI